MKINARNFGLAGAATLCTIYAAFALALKFFPIHTLRLIAITHMMPKLEYIRSFIKVTPEAIVIGLITHAIIAFLFFWLIARIYNAFQK